MATDTRNEAALLAEWAASLTDVSLAARLLTMQRELQYWTVGERNALLREAATRLERR
jgi:hypothetical protein